ncbi:hypothetical protein HDU98_008252 [Podochytrium sp. JEL0797]|nr:hypothetical protein HDU98_008252 [Podochytrium sp. JEL0797]
MASSNVTLTDSDSPVAAVLRMFYIVDPYSTTYTSVDMLPDFVGKAQPVFIGFLLFEMATILVLHLVQKLRGTTKRLPNFPRLNDMIGSVGAGVLQQTSQLMAGDVELILYIAIYERCGFLKLDERFDLVVWILALLGVDFCYYWAHRGAHELNGGWAGHVTHHNSQDYNLSTALRQSMTQMFFTLFFYLPLAFFIPPPVFALHKMLNLLFQFWIHTEVVPPLGYLEYIINTPSSHRVHHGRNPYCIDKNYAGVLIIWDILFGTYQPELPSEPVIFGITHNINTFNPLVIQFHHSLSILRSVVTAQSIREAFNRLVMGPGWTPEQPHLRLGDPSGIPRVPNLLKTPDADIGYFNPALISSKGASSGLANGLAAVHVTLSFVCVLLFQMWIQMNQSLLSWNAVALATGVCVVVLTKIGFVLDGGLGDAQGDFLMFDFECLWGLVAWPLLVDYYLGFLVEGAVDDLLLWVVRAVVPVGLLALFCATVAAGHLGGKNVTSAKQKDD